jgi:hypothetical protein
VQLEQALRASSLRGGLKEARFIRKALMATLSGFLSCRSPRIGLPIAIAVASFAAGCGASDLESPTAVRLKGLATVFLDYAVARGDGPKDEETLKAHMKQLPDFILEMNKVDPKDPNLFISDRDKEPFVFIWGTGISFGTPNTPMLAYEKTGKNGKRLVAFANGEVELVDDERFKKLSNAKPE